MYGEAQFISFQDRFKICVGKVSAGTLFTGKIFVDLFESWFGALLKKIFEFCRIVIAKFVRTKAVVAYCECAQKQL